MSDANTSANNGTGIEVALLEKRLEGLRDTQESVQGLSLWCQANKKHSTPIIDTWLRILRRSPVEKRLTMFYLANDVVQHAKRKGDLTVVNQWAVAVQKATPHVRSPSSVSTAIIRIFKIWEERGVYSKDTVADLIALVNKHNSSAKERTPETKKKPEIYTASDEKVKGFQSSALVSTMKQAFRLKSHLGVTFRTKQYVNMNMEQLIASIKDRHHGISVIENMSELLDSCRFSANKLVHEVDERRKIVEAAEVAIVYYENLRADARIVSSAYKNFTERVMKTKGKVDEVLRAFAEMEGSPIPSPERLSPYDEVKVILPPIAEFEARQAHASNLIEVSTNSATVSASSSTYNTECKPQYASSSNTGAGMLPSGTAYDLMSATQWPNYAMQLQMMQQQMAQAYAYQNQAESNRSQQQAPQQQAPQQPSQDLSSIPLPSDGLPPPSVPQPQPIPSSSTPQEQQQHVPVLQSPTIGHSNDGSTNPYESTTSTPHTPTPSNVDYSSMPTNYGSQEYSPSSFESNAYYDDERRKSVEYMSDSQHFETPKTPNTTRYHPYENSKPRPPPRRLSEGRPPRPLPRFTSQGPSSGFSNPPPFIPRNPANANLCPVGPGGPRSRFNYHSQSDSNENSITSNLLRLANQPTQQPTTPAHQEISPSFAATNDYVPDEGAESLNGGDESEEFLEYEATPPPRPQFHSSRIPGVAVIRGPRGMKTLRGARGSYGNSPGFRPRGRGRAPARRGSYFIL